MLIWCAVPPEYHGAGTIVTQALSRLGAHRPEALSEVPLGQILKVLFTLCVTEPRRAARRRKLRHLGRQVGRWFHPTSWSQPASDHRRSAES